MGPELSLREPRPSELVRQSLGQHCTNRMGATQVPWTQWATWVSMGHMRPIGPHGPEKRLSDNKK